MKYITVKECNKNTDLVVLNEYNTKTNKDNYIAKDIVIDVPFDESLVYGKFIEKVENLNMEEIKVEKFNEQILIDAMQKIKEKSRFKPTNLILSAETHKKYSKVLSKFDLDVFIDNKMSNNIYLYKKNSINHSGFMLFRYNNLYKFEEIGINIENLFLKINING